MKKQLDLTLYLVLDPLLCGGLVGWLIQLKLPTFALHTGFCF